MGLSSTSKKKPLTLTTATKVTSDDDEIIETPDGNEIEVTSFEVEENDPEYEETEEYADSDYGSGALRHDGEAKIRIHRVI